jgi:DNA-nicking Smr family endonuclease
LARFSLKEEDLRLWSLVTATVRPHLKIRKAKTPKPEPEIETIKIVGMAEPNTLKAQRIEPSQWMQPFTIGQSTKPENGFRLSVAAREAPYPIEPKRKRRLSRERDPIEAHLDLHGLTQIQAETRLKAFVTQAFAQDLRAILVITGKGFRDTGILKRYAPEWLADPALSHIVAGISQAHTRHGGSGALYVALKRRP